MSPDGTVQSELFRTRFVLSVRSSILIGGALRGGQSQNCSESRSVHRHRNTKITETNTQRVPLMTWSCLNDSGPIKPENRRGELVFLASSLASRKRLSARHTHMGVSPSRALRMTCFCFFFFPPAKPPHWKPSLLAFQSKRSHRQAVIGLILTARVPGSGVGMAVDGAFSNIKCDLPQGFKMYVLILLAFLINQ